MAPFPLIARQSSAKVWLWCRDCGYHYKAHLPIPMAGRPELVICPGCEIAGFLVGAPRRL